MYRSFLLQFCVLRVIITKTERSGFMLLVLFGVISEIGFKSRQYLIDKGFEFIIKYNYAPETPEVSVLHGTRNFVSEEEFYENTDSLFRYEFGGIKIGFNQKQISDAVCNRGNFLLSLSTGDIGFLKEIKRVYGDSVKTLYCCIDDNTLRSVISKYDISEREAEIRYQTGQDVKRAFANDSQIFDHIAIYGGEDSVFNFENLFKQYDAVVEKILGKPQEEIPYSDVYIANAEDDALIAKYLAKKLSERGVSVFDKKSISKDFDWMDAISDHIAHAKIVIPIVTGNALDCPEGIADSVALAGNTGALIVPMFCEDANACGSKLEILCSLPGIYDSEPISAAEKVAERIEFLLNAEARLKLYSSQVENCLCLKLTERAHALQNEYVALCDRLYLLSRGESITMDACLNARAKLVSILLDTEMHKEAVEASVEALSLIDSQTDKKLKDMLLNQFAVCCLKKGMDEEETISLAKEKLVETDEAALRLSIKNTLEQNSSQKDENGENACDTSDKNMIAKYGESIIELFEAALKNCGSNGRRDLLLGYERVLNYCKHMGLNDSVAEKCIERIGELSSASDAGCNEEDGRFVSALKIYLGQAMPRSGDYDVFISFKSEDAVLAKKVYDYLKQSGKEVFFSPETLPELGKTEYEKMIFDAIDRAKHMVLIGSNPDYLKTNWVEEEWSTFNNEIREGRKDGNLILVLSDDVAYDKGRLPTQLRKREIVKMSEFRSRLLSYLW